MKAARTVLSGPGTATRCFVIHSCTVPDDDSCAEFAILLGFTVDYGETFESDAGPFLVTTVDLSHRSEIYFPINHDDGMLGRAQPIGNYKLPCARENP